MTRSPVHFHLQCTAQCVYLVIGAAPDGPTSIVPMTAVRPHQWTTTLQMTPGLYRYRYYVGDEKVLTYHAPTDLDAEDSRSGMDVLRRVPKVPQVHVSSAHRSRQSSDV